MLQLKALFYAICDVSDRRKTIFLHSDGLEPHALEKAAACSGLPVNSAGDKKLKTAPYRNIKCTGFKLIVCFNVGRVGLIDIGKTHIEIEAEDKATFCLETNLRCQAIIKGFKIAFTAKMNTLPFVVIISFTMAK